MSNNSKQESEKAMSEMRDFDYKAINNLYQFRLNGKHMENNGRKAIIMK